RMQSSLAGVQAGVELPSSVVDLDRGNAKGMVTLIGFDPAAQGPFGSYRLSDGKTTLGQDLASDQVLVSASLAGALEARTGDRLRIAVGADRVVELRVAGIAKGEGPGAYTLRPALFTPLANLGPMLGGQGINVIRLVIVRALVGGNLLYTRPLETRAGLLLYAITPGSAGLSIAIGALIVLATLFATSIRSSRMQISSAIRNLPDPASRRKRSIW